VTRADPGISVRGVVHLNNFPQPWCGWKALQVQACTRVWSYPCPEFFLILPSKIQFPKFLTLELSVCEGIFKVYLSFKPEKQQ